MRLTQDCALRLLRGRHLQHLLHLFFGHPGCRSVETVLCDGEAALVMDFAAKLIVELHIENDTSNDRQKHRHAGKAFSGESMGKAGTEIPGYSGHPSLSGHAACIRPRLVILQ